MTFPFLFFLFLGLDSVIYMLKSDLQKESIFSRKKDTYEHLLRSLGKKRKTSVSFRDIKEVKLIEG